MVGEMLKLAIRNLLRYRFRTGMTLAAISFGVVGLILSGGFVEDVFIQLGEALIHSQSGHLQVARSGYFESGAQAPLRFLIRDLRSLRGLVAPLPEVVDVMARLRFSGLLNNRRSDWPINGEGFEPDKEAALGTYMRIVAGRQMTHADSGGIMIGQGVAQALQLTPGDRVTLLANSQEGALNSQDFELIGVFESFSKDYDAHAIRIPLPAAQDLLTTSGANSIVVSLRETKDTDAVATRLRAQLDGHELEVVTWVDLNDFYKKTVALYERQFGVLQVIVLAMVLLSVSNSVNMSVYERIGEFGTLMALGTRAGHVFRMVMLENTLLGLIGASTGVVIGAILAIVISAIGIPMPPPPNANSAYTAFIRIVPIQLAIAFSVGLLATVAAAVLPAYRTSRIPVAEALRENV